MSYDLPNYGELNIKKLSTIFNNTSASYKYIFFLSILNLIKDNPSKREFTYKEIEVEMIYLGWYPHTYYKLNFGYNDQLGNVLNSIGDISVKNNSSSTIKESIKNKVEPLDTTLLNMVPYRLLSVFVNDNSVDKTKDKSVINWANSLKDSPDVFYSFKRDIASKKDNSIVISSPWFNYLKDNYRIIHDYATYNFLMYMEKRNPNVLNLGQKLFPPSSESRNLSAAKEFWLNVSHKNNISCIYSGTKITDKNISIDHYLPWSFTAHNREWNLIPTSKEVNSAKSNKLPHKKYYESFIDMQFSAINITKNNKNLQKYLENYIADLKLDFKNLTLENLKNRYNNIYSPLFHMAENQGFETDWEY